MIFGKAVKIGPDEHDIQEGFEVVNFNFHVNGNLPPIPKSGEQEKPANSAPEGTFNNPGGVFNPAT